MYIIMIINYHYWLFKHFSDLYEIYIDTCVLYIMYSRTEYF